MTIESASAAWPVKTREVRNAYQDSTRWDGFTVRDDDVIVATWAKTGTTWTQQIVWQLIHGGPEGAFSTKVCPWVDARFAPIGEVIETVEAQPYRRCLKTHLPLDALVFSRTAKYLFVGRDARDVVWSAYNHQTGYDDSFFDFLNGIPDRGGPPARRIVDDVRQYYLDFLDGREWAGFEGNSFWDHTQGWWDARHLPNVLMVHFANLKADLLGQVRRIAAFLDVAPSEATLARIVDHCEIGYMREQARPAMADSAWKEGADTFFNNGTNGRWRDVLTPEEIARCDALAARRLSADCAHWLKTGEMGR